MVTKLPQFQSDDKDFQLMQNAWAAKLQPLLNNPSLQNLLLKNIKLIPGDNVINHKLGRTPQGWRIADIDAVSSIYRNAPFNPLTLTLNASAACTIALEVF